MRCPELRFSTNSDIEAVRKSILAYKCLLTTPLFLSMGTQHREKLREKELLD